MTHSTTPRTDDIRSRRLLSASSFDVMMQVPVWVSSVRHLPFLVGPPRAYLIDSYVTHRALPNSSSVASYHLTYIYLPSLRLFVHDLPVSTAVPAVRHSSGASCIFLGYGRTQADSAHYSACTADLHNSIHRFDRHPLGLTVWGGSELSQPGFAR